MKSLINYICIFLIIIAFASILRSNALESTTAIVSTAANTQTTQILFTTTSLSNIESTTAEVTSTINQAPRTNTTSQMQTTESQTAVTTYARATYGDVTVTETLTTTELTKTWSQIMTHTHLHTNSASTITVTNSPANVQIYALPFNYPYQAGEGITIVISTSTELVNAQLQFYPYGGQQFIGNIPAGTNQFNVYPDFSINNYGSQTIFLLSNGVQVASTVLNLPVLSPQPTTETQTATQIQFVTTYQPPQTITQEATIFITQTCTAIVQTSESSLPLIVLIIAVIVFAAIAFIFGYHWILTDKRRARS